MTPRTDKVSQFILPFQYLRGFISLKVVWFHSLFLLSGLQENFRIQLGGAFLYLFMVMSGFVMVVSTAGRNIAPLDFFKRRLIRIAPLYWLLTLLIVAIVLSTPLIFRNIVATPATVIQSLLFVPHYSGSDPHSVWPLLVPGWTLQLEMFFCVLYAASMTTKFQTSVLSSILIGCVLVGLLWGPFHNPILKTYTDPLLLDFVFGVAFGKLWLAGRLMLRWPLALGSCLIGLGFSFVGQFTSYANLMAVIGAALIALSCFNAPTLQWRNGPLLTLGTVSYSTYLTHTFTLAGFRWVWLKFQPGVPNYASGLIFMILATLTSLAIGWLTYRWVEAPMGKYLSDYLRRRSVARATLVSA